MKGPFLLTAGVALLGFLTSPMVLSTWWARQPQELLLYHMGGTIIVSVFALIFLFTLLDEESKWPPL